MLKCLTIPVMELVMLGQYKRGFTSTHLGDAYTDVLGSKVIR